MSVDVKFKIDNVVYDVTVKKMSRNFEALDTQNTNRTLDGVMHRDVIGVFYNYSLELETKNLNVQQYDALYEVISSPDEKHTLTFPYGQQMFTFEAYITNGSDDLMLMKEGMNLWGNLKFNIIAIAPKRRA